MISRGQQRAASPWAAVAVGLSAHAGAAGCLPALLPTLFVLPVAFMAVRASDRCLQRRGLVARGAAAQAVVHAAFTLANPCASHPGSAGQGHASLGVEAVMTAAHVLALILCVAVAAHVERSVAGLLTHVGSWVRGLLARRTPLHVETARRTAGGHQRQGFVPSPVEHRHCGITRGPPGRLRCLTPA